ncbi:MAG: beta-ketoacyl synthase N-terminal-like domain-containing protein, partial [Chloroflexota bacterium]
MRKRVVLTGMGCISPLGQSVPETWDGVVLGRSGAGPITHFDASTHKTRFAAEVKEFDGVGRFGTREARKMDPFAQFAVAAADEAMNQARLQIDEANRDRTGIIVGTGIGGIGTMMANYEVLKERGADRVSPFLIPMMISDSAAGMLAIRTGARGPNMAIATACATGTNALGEAAAMIRRGAADIMLVGSAEAAIGPLAMAGLNAMTALS